MQQLPSLSSSRPCTETSHCLNSAHSIPVPGSRPAAASSLQACPTAWAETDTGLTTARVIHYTHKRAFIDMQSWTLLLEMRQSATLATSILTAKVQADLPQKGRLAAEGTGIITSPNDPSWNLTHLTPLKWRSWKFIFIDISNMQSVVANKDRGGSKEEIKSVLVLKGIVTCITWLKGQLYFSRANLEFDFHYDWMGFISRWYLKFTFGSHANGSKRNVRWSVHL